jgi:NADPH:quinone reductase-like Zn-dependent oxidoreductase
MSGAHAGAPHEPAGRHALHRDRSRAAARPGEVLIVVHAAGVNGPDVQQRKGVHPPLPAAVPVLGLEVAGEVRHVTRREKRNDGLGRHR